MTQKLSEDTQDIEGKSHRQRELLLRGYEYGPHFQGIYKAWDSGEKAWLHWTKNWVTFLDAMLQTALLAEHGDSLRLPTRLRYLRIDPKRHLARVSEKDDMEVVELRHHAGTHGLIAGGVEICDLEASSVQRRLHTTGRQILEKVLFVPNHEDDALARWPEARGKLEQYSRLCHRQLGVVLGKWGAGVDALPNAALLRRAADALSTMHLEDVSEAYAKATAYSKKDSTSLYRLLLQLEDTEPRKEVLSSLMRDWEAGLDGDAELAGIWEQETAKGFLDMVFQNTPGHFFHFSVLCPRSLTVTNVSNVAFGPCRGI